MPLDSFTSELVLEEVFKWVGLTRQREEADHIGLSEKIQALHAEAREVDKIIKIWLYPHIDLTDEELEEKKRIRYFAWKNGHILVRERHSCAKKVQYCNTVLRRVVNHLTFAVVKEFPPLIDPWGPTPYIRPW